MSFSLEGHGKHYVKLACGGVEVGPIPSNVYLIKKERPVCISIEDYAVVLLLGVVSLMAGSATGVPMSPGCYTDAPQVLQHHAAPSYYTESPQYYSSPSITTKGKSTTPRLPNTTPTRHQTSTSAAPAYYTEVYKCYTTMYPEYYTTAHVAPTYYAECPKKLWCRAAANVVTMMADRPLVCRYLLGMVGITTTYTTTAYYAETCKCQTTKASEYVGTTVYVGTSYYAEAPK
ncbi:hypothetical protein DAPPUDRAFT_234744 [Daphnia pulex]|uniref:Uncharacterized protein n=1 Tax=Daphnia pulex TaxID=6669 RepID=E9FXA8_DAPPU|nr:hypothetical protein DAPPUDRAFT_234744 [Daphnia pulex]|eukprot:EFX88048.1 hypothetical protein DAPPUDRAFT_234744 [Daphnia pulex]